MKQVKLTDQVDEKLSELSKKRKAEGSPVATKQSIVASLILDAHKKEVK